MSSETTPQIGSQPTPTTVCQPAQIHADSESARAPQAGGLFLNTLTDCMADFGDPKKKTAVYSQMESTNGDSTQEKRRVIENLIAVEKHNHDELYSGLSDYPPDTNCGDGFKPVKRRGGNRIQRQWVQSNKIRKFLNDLLDKLNRQSTAASNPRKTVQLSTKQTRNFSQRQDTLILCRGKQMEPVYTAMETDQAGTQTFLKNALGKLFEDLLKGEAISIKKQKAVDFLTKPEPGNEDSITTFKWDRYVFIRVFDTIAIAILSCKRTCRVSGFLKGVVSVIVNALFELCDTKNPPVPTCYSLSTAMKSAVFSILEKEEEMLEKDKNSILRDCVAYESVIQHLFKEYLDIEVGLKTNSEFPKFLKDMIRKDPHCEIAKISKRCLAYAGVVEEMFQSTLNVAKNIAELKKKLISTLFASPKGWQFWGKLGIRDEPAFFQFARNVLAAFNHEDGRIRNKPIPLPVHSTVTGASNSQWGQTITNTTTTNNFKNIQHQQETEPAPLPFAKDNKNTKNGCFDEFVTQSRRAVSGSLPDVLRTLGNLDPGTCDVSWVYFRKTCPLAVGQSDPMNYTPYVDLDSQTTKSLVDFINNRPNNHAYPCFNRGDLAYRRAQRFVAKHTLQLVKHSNFGLTCMFNDIVKYFKLCVEKNEELANSIIQDIFQTPGTLKPRCKDYNLQVLAKIPAFNNAVALWILLNVADTSQTDCDSKNPGIDLIEILSDRTLGFATREDLVKKVGCLSTRISRNELDSSFRRKPNTPPSSFNQLVSGKIKTVPAHMHILHIIGNWLFNCSLHNALQKGGQTVEEQFSIRVEAFNPELSTKQITRRVKFIFAICALFNQEPAKGLSSSPCPVDITLRSIMDKIIKESHRFSYMDPKDQRKFVELLMGKDAPDAGVYGSLVTRQGGVCPCGEQDTTGANHKFVGRECQRRCMENHKSPKDALLAIKVYAKERYSQGHIDSVETAISNISDLLTEGKLDDPFFSSRERLYGELEAASCHLSAKSMFIEHALGGKSIQSNDARESTFLDTENAVCVWCGTLTPGQVSAAQKAAQLNIIQTRDLTSFHRTRQSILLGNGERFIAKPVCQFHGSTGKRDSDAMIYRLMRMVVTVIFAGMVFDHQDELNALLEVFSGSDVMWKILKDSQTQIAKTKQRDISLAYSALQVEELVLFLILPMGIDLKDLCYTVLRSTEISEFSKKADCLLKTTGGLTTPEHTPDLKQSYGEVQALLEPLFEKEQDTITQFINGVRDFFEKSKPKALSHRSTRIVAGYQEDQSSAVARTSIITDLVAQITVCLDAIDKILHYINISFTLPTEYRVGESSTSPPRVQGPVENRKSYARTVSDGSRGGAGGTRVSGKTGESQ